MGGSSTSATDGAPGTGGSGIVGSGQSIINSGTTTGGLSGDGSTQADAIHFGDGTATPVMNHTYTLITFASQSGFSLGNFSYNYSGNLPGLTGSFILNTNSLQFKVTTLPVTLQSFSVQ